MWRCGRFCCQRRYAPMATVAVRRTASTIIAPNRVTADQRNPFQLNASRYRRWGARGVTSAVGRVAGVSDAAETPEIEFRSDVTVELVRASAADSDVLFAARVSTQGEQTLDAAAAGTEA